MIKLKSFRWSRLTVVSAWKRLCEHWELLLMVVAMVGVVSIMWWHDCWILGIPLLLILAIYVICTADGYCKVGNNKYYFYKYENGYQMEVYDYNGWRTEEVLAWEYEKVSGGRMPLLYCNDDNCWNMVSWSRFTKLGTRLNAASFVLEKPTVLGVPSLQFMILHCGVLYDYPVKKVYAGKNLKVCFTEHETAALSEIEKTAEYVAIQTMDDDFLIWRIVDNGSTFYATKRIGAGPSFIVNDNGRVSVWVWNYELHSYQEIFDDEVEALSVSGRFVKFKDSAGPIHVVISEFNPESKKVMQIYDGKVSSIDFVTGDFTV